MQDFHNRDNFDFTIRRFDARCMWACVLSRRDTVKIAPQFIAGYANVTISIVPLGTAEIIAGIIVRPLIPIRTVRRIPCHGVEGIG
jgi:hypothetical protein